MNDPDLLKVALGVLTHDTLRYLIGAGGVWLVVNLGLAAGLAARKIRPETPGWSQIRRELAASARTVLIFAGIGFGITLAAIFGHLNIYGRIDEHGWPWFAFTVAAIIVAHDAWFYWAHWLMHRVRFLRRTHMVHHRSNNPTPFTSYAFSAAEAAIQAAFLPLFLVLVPMHPAAILIFTGHMMLRNAIGHCGYELFPADRAGRPLFDWMTTVTHHDLHHAEAGSNFGLYFTWWDRWMGTENPRYLSTFARVAGAQSPSPA